MRRGLQRRSGSAFGRVHPPATTTRHNVQCPTRLAPLPEHKPDAPSPAAWFNDVVQCTSYKGQRPSC